MQDSFSIIIPIAVAIIILGVFGYSFYKKKQRKDMSWTGVVLDKKIHEHVNDRDDASSSRNGNGTSFSIGGISIGGSNTSSVTHSYSIAVRLDGDGSTLEWPISSGMYEQISIGDKLVKKPGSEVPEIIEKATPLQPVAQPSMQPQPQAPIADNNDPIQPPQPPQSPTLPT